MASMWCYWGNFRLTKMFPVNPYGFDSRAAFQLPWWFSQLFHQWLPWGHFLNVPSMGSLRLLINFFAGTLDLCIFITAFGCGFWCALSVDQNFFPAFRGVTEWLVPGLGLQIIFQIVLFFRWELWADLKWLWDIEALELGDVFRNTLREVSQGWSEKCF